MSVVAAKIFFASELYGLGFAPYGRLVSGPIYIHSRSAPGQLACSLCVHRALARR